MEPRMSVASMVDDAADRDCERGAGVRATEAGSGEESALLVRNPELVNGGAFETPSLVPKSTLKEHSSNCSECSNGGAKVAPSACASTFRAAPRGFDASLTHAAGDELMDFIAAELEQQRSRISALSTGQSRLERAMAASECDVADLAREQRDKNSKQIAFMRRLEAEVARGAELRSEEAQLRDARLEKALRTIRRDVEGSLATFKRTQEARLVEMEEKVDRMVIDVVVENQTLKAENMEIRVALQQVSAAASSNKKTLRVLTDEILKLKRQLTRSSSTSDSDSTSDRLERGIALALRAASPDTANCRR